MPRKPTLRIWQPSELRASRPKRTECAIWAAFELYLNEQKTDAEQLELNKFWDASVPVGNYFAASMALIEAKDLDGERFFDRLDTFTSVAFPIVYPGFKWLSERKGLGADLRSFRCAAVRAQANSMGKGIINDFTRMNLDVAPYL